MGKKQDMDHSDQRNEIGVEQSQNITNSRTEGHDSERSPINEEEQQNSDTKEHTSDTVEKENTAISNTTVVVESEEETDKRGTGSIFLRWIKSGFNIAVSVATLVTALLSLFTLLEMRTERINAYKPEIVIVRDMFEGGEADSSEIETDQDYMYFDYGQPEPWSWYLGSTSNELEEDAFLDPIRQKTIDTTNLLYIEEPYLTLKNIGKETAKEIKVEFSIDWVKNMVSILNQGSLDDYQFSMVIFADNQFSVECKKMSESMTYVLEQTYDQFDRRDADINYIAPNEDLVKVAIPASWCKILALYYAQNIRTLPNFFQPSPGKTIEETLQHAKMNLLIPDLIISISYEDIQGIKYEETLNIPWTAYYKYEKSETLKENKEFSIHLYTGFYEDYIR